MNNHNQQVSSAQLTLHQPVTTAQLADVNCDSEKTVRWIQSN
jgi:hypothetical protein